jgi:hypothetical protein
MHPVAVVLQYTTQCNTIHKKHKITHTHSKRYTTQKLETIIQNKHNNTNAKKGKILEKFIGIFLRPCPICASIFIQIAVHCVLHSFSNSVENSLSTWIRIPCKSFVILVIRVQYTMLCYYSYIFVLLLCYYCCRLFFRQLQNVFI